MKSKLIIIITICALVAFNFGCTMSRTALDGARNTIKAGVDTGFDAAIKVIDVANNLKNTATSGAKESADTVTK